MGKYYEICITYGSEEVFEEAATIILLHNGARCQLLYWCSALCCRTTTATTRARNNDVSVSRAFSLVRYTTPHTHTHKRALVT